MDVRLSAEQRALRDSAARVVGHLGPDTVADLDDADRRARLDDAVTSTGWRKLRTADEHGTPWASGVEVCVVAEELGRSVADTPFLGPILAAELRRLADAPAATEPETVLLTPDLSILAVTAGGAPPRHAVAIDAAAASQALALTEAPGGLVLVTVALGDLATPVDLTRPVASVGAGARAEAVVGQTTTLENADLERVRTLGLAVAAADLVGTMTGAVALTTGYAAERHQYGRPVGSFQAVQHLLADAHVVTEGSRSLARYASWAVDALPDAEAATAAAMAKAYATSAARDVGETAIQVHGGIGNTWECKAHVFLRRALLSGDVFGGVDASLERVLHDRLRAG